MEKGNNEITKLQSKFNKVYFDTLQHRNNIEKWIKAGNRKERDLRKSMQRLENKYQQMLLLKKQLEERGITNNDLLNDIYRKKDNNNYNKNTSKVVKVEDFTVLEKNIDNLYNMSKTKNPRHTDKIKDIRPKHIDYKERYSGVERVESIYDIPGNEKIVSLPDSKTKQRFKKFIKGCKKILGIEDKDYKMDEPVFVQTRFGDKTERLLDKGRKIIKKPNKLSKGIASLLMAASMIVSGGSVVGELNSNANVSKDTVDTNQKTQSSTLNKETKKNDFKSSIAVESKNIEKVTIKSKTAKLTPTKTSVKYKKDDKKIPSDTIQKNEYQDKEGDIYTVKKGTKYTEVSDGSGNVGYFSKDTQVKKYTIALVRTNKDGKKQILYYTKKGQTTLKQLAKENNISSSKMKEYKKDKNIKKCYSLQSVDGKKLYGWVGELAEDKTNDKDDFTR